MNLDKELWRIDKDRYHQLKKVCYHYPKYKEMYEASSAFDDLEIFDPTGETACTRSELKRRIDAIDKAILCTTEVYRYYLYSGITEGHSYDYMETVESIPLSRNWYYNLYRRFFWNLNNLY